MKKHLLCLVIAGLAASSFAQSLAYVPAAPLELRAQEGPGTSAWSAGVIADFQIKGKGVSVSMQAVAFNDFKAFTRDGKPTNFYWAGFLGTTADRDGHAVAGLGLHYVRKWLDQFYLGGFAGVDVQMGGAPSGIAIGLNVGIKF